MDLTRTTLRIRTDLKKRAEKIALEKNTTLQEIFNVSLAKYLEESARNKAEEIVFKTHKLGVALDNLKRKNYYELPQTK